MARSSVLLLYAAAFMAAVLSGADVAPADTCVMPPPNMEAWWPGDDCTPYDLWDGHDGTFMGAPFCPFDWKVGGGALGFQTDPPTYIVVPHDVDLDPGMGEITIDLWLKTEINANYAPIVEKLNFGGYQFGLWGGVPAFVVCDDMICQIAQASTPVNDGDWHHLAATLVRNDVVPDQLKVYIDGEVAASSMTPLGSVGSTDDLLIGAAPSHGTPTVGIAAVMDEIEIFSRALSDTEIRLLYVADSLGKCKIACLADLNGDGMVDAADLALLLGGWGPCP